MMKPASLLTLSPLSFLFKLGLALILGSTAAVAQEGEELVINAIVDADLQYYIEVPSDITDLSFDSLPAGLSFDPADNRVHGIATTAGTFNAQLSFIQSGTPNSMPARFEVYLAENFPGDPNDPNADSQPEPLVINGVVAYALSFELVLPPDATGPAFDALPAGLSLNLDTWTIEGAPTTAGPVDATLSFSDLNGTHLQPVRFEIYNEGEFGGDPNNPNPIDDHYPPDQGYTEPPIHITANVGNPLDFPLPIDTTVTDLFFDYLPDGLVFDADRNAVVGTPVAPGYFEMGLSATRGTDSIRFPVYIDIFGDSGHGDAILIHGWVGQFLSFSLPVDLSVAQVSLTEFPDTTTATLPVGLQLDAAYANIVGIPQEAGFFNSSISIVENGESRDIPVSFEIQHSGTDGGGPVYHQEESEVFLFGGVGTRFSFKFPTKEGDTVEMPGEWNGELFSLPIGLSFDPATNAITGSPTESGAFKALAVIHSDGFTREKRLNFLVSDGAGAPKLSFFSENEFGVGESFSFPILASGEPTEFEVLGLPDGVTYDASTGIVSGVLDYSEDFDLVVRAANASGNAYGIHFMDIDYAENQEDPNSGSEPDGGMEEGGDVSDPIFARVGVPFKLKAPSEYVSATFALAVGETFPAGLGFDATENVVISGVPTEAGLFYTTLSIANGGVAETVKLPFFVNDSYAAPQFVASDYIFTNPGRNFELPLPIANGPATITLKGAPEGINYDSTTKSLRGVLSNAGFYSVLVLATTDSGSGLHVVDIDVFDDGSGIGDGPIEPMRAVAIVGEDFDFPLPVDPSMGTVAFVDSDDGAPSQIPSGLQYDDTHGIIRGIPEQEGFFDLFLEISEYGFTRREHIIIEVFTHETLPPEYLTGPGYDEPDDGHVEPILGTVGTRLYFEAPISGDGVTFELVNGPDGEPSELPPGVNFDATIGVLSGTPTASGIYPIWVKVDDLGSVSTHFAPVVVSGMEGSPVITSEQFFSTTPGEHFTFSIAASNEPTDVQVDFFDVPGILSFDPQTMILEGKFDFGGFYTLLVSATNDVGTGYGLLNIDVLGLHDGGDGSLPPPEIPLHINGVVNQEISYELPSFVRGSTFVVSNDPGGYPTQLPDGLSIDAKTGRIYGTPTQTGYHFTWVVVDDGALPPLAINIGVAPSKPTPIIVSSDWWVGHQDAPFRYEIHATDFPTQFHATGLPAGLTVDAATGAITGTPTVAGDYQVTLSAENSAGVGEKRILFLFIEEKPRLPVVSVPFYTEGQVGATLSLQVTATESPQFYHATGLPAGLSMDPDTGLISGTPIHSGYFPARVEASNEFGIGSRNITIYIKRALAAPIYTGPSHVGGKVGVAFSFQPPVSGEASEFAISADSPNALPAGLAIDAATGRITGTPTETISGYIEVEITGPGGSITVPVYMKVVPSLDAPVVSSNSLASGRTGQGFQYQIAASNSPVEFAANPLPTGLTLDPATGIISGTPESAGYFDLLLKARNSSGWGPARLLILDIIPGLQTPMITSAPWAKGQAGQPFSYQITANNEPSGFEVSDSLPEGLSLDSATGVISGTPTAAGVSVVIISGFNASGPGNGMEFILAVRPSQDMPSISSSGTAFGRVGASFVYQIRASGSPTSYAADNLPDGLSVNTATGFITGTPVEPTTDPVVLVITATNSAGQSLQRAVLLEILPAEEAPVILTGGHAIGKVGVAFEFEVFATNEPTAYLSPNLPQGLSIASDTGLITGTPEKAGEFQVTLRASNAAGTGEPATLAVFIFPGADMPRVKSAPSAVGKVGEEFSYQIVASTDNIDSYQVEGDLPRGLDFDPITGLISGAPVEPTIVSVHLTATNAAGTSAPQPLTIKIDPSLEAPVITSSLRVRGTVGEEFEYAIGATNMPEERPLPPGAEFDAIGLPSGLGVNAATGVVSGVPSEAGSFIATLVATNETGTGNPRFATIEIKPAPTAPVVTSVTRINAQVGSTLSYQIVATNEPTSYDADHSISWLTVDTRSGALSGTPTKPGTFYAGLYAENDAGSSEPGPLEIVVYPAADTPKITSVRDAEGKVGQAFSYHIVGTNTPSSYAVNGLPAGLKLDRATGAISGTPTASGTFETVMVASNANGEGSRATLTLTISPRTAISIVSPDAL